MNFSFQIESRDRNSLARTGCIRTPHGDIPTPAFVPVGTQATVKSLTPDELRNIGVPIFFVNTYHVFLRPGIRVISRLGGLHGFMSWNGPVITDSGGFQVFSLNRKKFVNSALSESAVLDHDRFMAKSSRKILSGNHVFPDDYRPVGELVRIDSRGVTFTSHWDGSEHRFTPEKSIRIQHVLGSDIMIAFDECAAYPTTHEYARSAMLRTHAWLKRCISEKNNLLAKGTRYQALYGVVQGAIYEDLRTESARFVGGSRIDGIAIGGVSVGESKKEMASVLSWVMPHIPGNLPVHLLGVGEIDDIFTLVSWGVDTFDCVQPTRLARMGYMFHSEKNPVRRSNTGKPYMFDITKRNFHNDVGPIDSACSCYACKNFSRAYIHHLFRTRELLAYRLGSLHNIHFVTQLTAAIRQAISDSTFTRLKAKWLT